MPNEGMTNDETDIDTWAAEAVAELLTEAMLVAAVVLDWIDDLAGRK